MDDRIHITTAIFYCNGIPHVGSAYEALAADVFARYQRRKLGRDNVTFLSGTDEHGDKIRRAAIAQGLAPKAYTDKMSVLLRDAFAGLNVGFDYWVRTTIQSTKSSCRKCSRGPINVATSTSAITRGSTASIASAS